VQDKNQGGAVTEHLFNIRMVPAKRYIQTAEKTVTDSTAVVAAGSSITLGLDLPSVVRASDVTWSDGSTGATLDVSDLQTSATYTATFTLRGTEHVMPFHILVKPTEASLIEPGQYLLRHVATDTYLTAQARNQAVTFGPLAPELAGQCWCLERSSAPKYGFISLATADSLKLNSAGKMATAAYYPFFIEQAVGSDRIAIHTSATSKPKYWDVADGLVQVTTATTLTAFPFQLVPYSPELAVEGIAADARHSASTPAPLFDLSGRRVPTAVRPGIYVSQGRKVVVR